MRNLLLALLCLPGLALADNTQCQKALETAKKEVQANSTSEAMDHFRALCRSQHQPEIEHCAVKYALWPYRAAQTQCVKSHSDLPK